MYILLHICGLLQEDDASIKAKDASSKQETQLSDDNAASGAVDSGATDDSDTVSQAEQTDAHLGSEDGGHLVICQDSSRAAEIAVLKASAVHCCVTE